MKEDSQKKEMCKEMFDRMEAKLYNDDSFHGSAVLATFAGER